MSAPEPNTSVMNEKNASVMIVNNAKDKIAKDPTASELIVNELIASVKIVTEPKLEDTIADMAHADKTKMIFDIDFFFNNKYLILVFFGLYAKNS